MRVAQRIVLGVVVVEGVYGGGIVEEGLVLGLVGVECSHGPGWSVGCVGASGRGWAAMVVGVIGHGRLRAM